MLKSLSFLFAGLFASAVFAADVVVVDASGTVTVTGNAPAAPAANEVRMGAGQVLAGGTVAAGDVTITRVAAATKNQAVRGDDPRIAKAWVYFKGNPVQVFGSQNIASVVRNSVGNYTINFTTPFASKNYAAMGTANDDNAIPTLTYEMGTIGQYRTTASIRIYAVGTNGTPRDASAISWVFYETN